MTGGDGGMGAATVGAAGAIPLGLAGAAFCARAEEANEPPSTMAVPAIAAMTAIA
jgi:hypothetical protein